MWHNHDEGLAAVCEEDRSERFVTLYDFVEAFAHRFDIKRPLHADGRWHVEIRIAGHELIEKPESLLRERERHLSFPAHLLDLPLFSSLSSGQPPLYFVGQPFYCRPPEQLLQADLHSQHSADPSQHLRRS